MPARAPHVTEKGYSRAYDQVGEDLVCSREIQLKIWQLRATNSGGMWINKMADWCNSYMSIKIDRNRKKQ